MERILPNFYFPDLIKRNRRYPALKSELCFPGFVLFLKTTMATKQKPATTTADTITASNEFIEVYGAREHNLKNIDIQIPKNKLVVFTGVSGSGKSSLAFDTIYNEGQRRYMESFSAYARQFIGDMERPDVDKITGLSPVISIEQKTPIKTHALPWAPLQRYMILCVCCLPALVKPIATIQAKKW